MGWLAEKLMARVTRREPDLYIGGREDPYLIRWHVIPRNRFFKVYLHCFKRSDDDRALHDHPWLFNLSWILRNRCREWFPSTEVVAGPRDFQDHDAGSVKLRWGAAPHRIELTHGECWTLFITGPNVRQWGFHCVRGWRHWKDFSDPNDRGAVGRGCD